MTKKAQTGLGENPLWNFVAKMIVTSIVTSLWRSGLSSERVNNVEGDNMLVAVQWWLLRFAHLGTQKQKLRKRDAGH